MARQARYDSALAVRNSLAELLAVIFAGAPESLGLLPLLIHVIDALLGELRLAALQARPDSSLTRPDPLAEFLYVGLADAFTLSLFLGESDNRNDEESRHYRYGRKNDLF